MAEDRRVVSSMVCPPLHCQVLQFVQQQQLRQSDSRRTVLIGGVHGVFIGQPTGPWNEYMANKGSVDVGRFENVLSEQAAVTGGGGGGLNYRSHIWRTSCVRARSVSNCSRFSCRRLASASVAADA